MRKIRIITLASILTMGITLLGQSRTSQDYNGPKMGGAVTETWGEPEDFPILVKNSPLIIKGKVIKTESKMESKGGVRDLPFTYSNIEIREIYKNTLEMNSAVITVCQSGGFFDDITIRNERNPTFKVGEEYILILRPNDGTAWVIAQSIGRFHLADGRAYQKHKSVKDKLDNGWNELLKARGYPTDVTERELVSKIQNLELSTPK